MDFGWVSAPRPISNICRHSTARNACSLPVLCPPGGGHDPNRHGGPGPAGGARETRRDSRRGGGQKRCDRWRNPRRATLIEPDREKTPAGGPGAHEKALKLVAAGPPPHAPFLKNH